MADIEFRVTDGPYVGNYEIDIKDISASDVGDLLAQRGPDLDEVLAGGKRPGARDFAGLVWVSRRRGNKGLAFRAVSDNISLAIIDALEGAPEETAERQTHPSPSADA